MKLKVLPIIFIILIECQVLADENKFNSDILPIGNPATKFALLAVEVNKICQTASGNILSEAELIDKLNNYQVIMLGETHTNDFNHQVQLNIIKGLVEKGQSICLALEMFTPDKNQVFNDYVTGKIDEEQFLDKVDYFNSWGHNYRYYKPIFDYAREKEIKMFGVNIEQKYASKIGRSGIKSLSADEQKNIPLIDTTNVEHRFYINVAMEGMAATAPAQFSNIYAAQCLWDAVMGNGIIKVFNQNPRSRIVLLAGSGHVAYNLGIGKILKIRSNLAFASVLCVSVPDSVQESAMMKVKKNIKEKKDAVNDSLKTTNLMPHLTMKHGIVATPQTVVAASLADFLWGIPEEKQEKFPSFGFSLHAKNEKGFAIKIVSPESIAEKQGIKQGDVILSIDDNNFPTMADMKKYLAYKNWHDQIKLRILREGAETEIEFAIEPIEGK